MKFQKKELELFFYWINERHRIYLAKAAGAEWPWTKDKILREFKFTNPFRQLDRVTQEWTTRYMRLLSRKMKNEDIFFHLCMFRFFNWPETYDALVFNMKGMWNNKDAKKILQKRIDEDHEKIFTGAYIITAGGQTGAKHESICDALNIVYEKRKEMCLKIIKGRSMQKATEIIQEIPTQGPFTAYEIACDLRHTKILHDARDIMMWANPGPGAKRGIHRLLTGKYERPDEKIDYNAAMRELLLKATTGRGTISDQVKKCEWPFEMREIEHSLCEYDKYRRVARKEGTPRSRYHYKPKQMGLPWDDDDE